MRAFPRPPEGDEGFSLIEVVMTTVILGFVMAVVTGAIIEVYSAVNRVDTTASARDQLSNVFRRLDKELRYATWLSSPDKVNGVYYFEYSAPTPVSPVPSPAPTVFSSPPSGCRQLAWNNGTLTLASWNPATTSTPGPPTTLASGLSLNGTIPPFTVYAANTKPYATASADVSGVGRSFAPEHAQVRIQFLGTQGKTSLPYDVIFTAQNNTGTTPGASPCSKGRPH
jgi:prepilin-type N-terminal cleavage/methylation domain-containing protein